MYLCNTIHVSIVFGTTPEFNGDLSKWDIGNIEHNGARYMFWGSGHSRSLCGEWIKHLVGGSKCSSGQCLLYQSNNRYGCCPAGSFMSSPNVSPFSVAESCHTCPTEFPSSMTTAENDETSCQGKCVAGKFYSSSLGCLDCSPGKFSSSAGSSPCQECVPGQYQNNSAAMTCHDCLPGKFSVVGFDECRYCSRGAEFVDSLTSCRVCNYSHYQDKSDVPYVTCRICPTNTYLSDDRKLSGAHDSEEKCIPCSEGRVATAGERSCTTCPSGYKAVIDNNSTVCDICTSGKYQNLAGQKDCKKCPSGWTQQADGQGFCFPCEPGSTQIQEGQESCDNCETGRYIASAKANETCFDCGKGEYQDQKGQSNCKRCSAGKWSNKKGLIVSSGCTDCVAGTYSPAEGAQNYTSCIDCPSGKNGSVVGAVSAGETCEGKVGLFFSIDLPFIFFVPLFLCPACPACPTCPLVPLVPLVPPC